MIKKEHFFAIVEDTSTGLPYHIFMTTKEKDGITGKEDFPLGEIWVVHGGDYSSYYTATRKLKSYLTKVVEYEV
jgi:hypothetical protein